MASQGKWKYKSYQTKYKHSQKLDFGMKGFLCTCNGKFREKDCLRESYNILNEFADELFGPQVRSDDLSVNNSKNEEDVKNSEQECDIEASLSREISSIKADVSKRPELRRFQVLESGANGIVFVKTTVSDPVKLAHKVVSTYAKGIQKSKFLLRLLPVEVTCKAYVDDICNAIEPLLEKYFSGNAKTFAVVFNHRNNDKIKRDELIERVPELVYKKNSSHKADLKQPELVILIEVIRSICCLSVIPEYYQLRKYNLLENALKGNEGAASQERQEEVKTEEGATGESNVEAFIQE